MAKAKDEAAVTTAPALELGNGWALRGAIRCHLSPDKATWSGEADACTVGILTRGQEISFAGCTTIQRRTGVVVKSVPALFDLCRQHGLPTSNGSAEAAKAILRALGCGPKTLARILKDSTPIVLPKGRQGSAGRGWGACSPSSMNE